MNDNQCDQFGQFFKVLCHKFSFRDYLRYLATFLDSFEVSQFLSKLFWLYFGHLLENLGYFDFQHLVTLTNFVRKSITIRIVSCLTGLVSAKQ